MARRSFNLNIRLCDITGVNANYKTADAVEFLPHILLNGRS